MLAAKPISRSTISAILHEFPSLIPSRHVQVKSSFLATPMRKDILHRAVVFERDSLRQGSASSKTRAEVSGSTRKIRRQKGSGQARLGDRTSPMLRGGGRAHGPKPRDFSTELPRKVYNLALRTAFSHLYNIGSLLCIDGAIDLPTYKTAASMQFFKHHDFTSNGRTLFILDGERKNLQQSVGNLGYLCDVVQKEDVMICNLLTYARVIVEKKALLYLEENSRIE